MNGSQLILSNYPIIAYTFYVIAYFSSGKNNIYEIDYILKVWERMIIRETI